MKCSNCNEELENNANFCSKCGQKVEFYCPQCKNIIKQGNKFCSNCGYKLTEENIVLENNANIENIEDKHCEANDSKKVYEIETKNDWNGIVKGNYENIDESELYFETIPISKIIWLSILTLGIYQIVWFYKIWKTLDRKFGYKNTPFFRAIFACFTSFWLFPILSRYIKKFNLKSFNAILFSTLYLVLVPFYSLSDRAPAALWLIGFLSIVIIAVIQSKINKVNKKNFPEAPINKWCGINTFWALFGGILLVLSLLEIFYPSIYEELNAQNETEIQQVQKLIEEMKEYNFKYISLSSPIPLKEIEVKANSDYKYLKQYSAEINNIAILIEEGSLAKNKSDSRIAVYNIVTRTISEEKAMEVINNIPTSIIGDIQQTPYDYELGEWKMEIRSFSKDDKYVFVAVNFDKNNEDLEKLVHQILLSIKLLF